MSEKEKWPDTYDILYEHLIEEKKKNWTVIVEEDDKGELILPIPHDLLSQMGWDESTELWWDIDKNGNVILKVNKNEPSEK